ncbi:MAG: hypothetical protein EHM71_09880, partial [Zetaproteobacteria bacterium]
MGRAGRNRPQLPDPALTRPARPRPPGRLRHAHRRHAAVARRDRHGVSARSGVEPALRRVAALPGHRLGALPRPRNHTPACPHRRVPGDGSPGSRRVKRGEPASPSLLSQTRAFLRARGLQPRRGRGQNFLVDPGVRDRIVAAAGLGPASLVVEIGPGTGILTEAILRAGAAVLAIEVDRGLVLALSERLGGHPRFAVRQADALEFDFAAALEDDPRRGRIRVVANIPYYITTPIILRLVR